MFIGKSCRSRHFEFHIGTKNVKFVEDHPMNIHVQFGFNNIKRFFSEITSSKTKLPRNDHWKVLYNFFVFYADRKSKMAATAIHRLTLDPMGKCSNAFFSETTNIINEKNCRGPSNDHSWAVWFLT
jgi:hypothetical protein